MIMKKLLYLLLLTPIILLTSCSKSGVTPQTIEEVIIGKEWCLDNENKDGFLLAEDGKFYITAKCQSNYYVGDWKIEESSIKYTYTYNSQEVITFVGEVTGYSESKIELSYDSIIDVYLLDTLDIYGCIDNQFSNYNSTANCDDGSCVPFINGCTDTLAINYDSQANTDDGSCIILEIGDFYQNGIIFWLDNTNKHGLICKVNDIGGASGASWDCTGIGGLGGSSYVGELFYGVMSDITSIGTGKSNTNVIVSQLYNSPCNSNPQTGAANICHQNGWFLPSKDELQEMYINRTVINSTALSNGGTIFINDEYWSSSEDSQHGAWGTDFSDGYQPRPYKGRVNYVRPVKDF